MERKTKLIWSIEAEQCQPELLKTFKPRAWDAVRIVYNHKHEKKILEFLEAIRKLSAQHGCEYSVMLDLVNNSQAKIKSALEKREVVYDQELVLSKKSAPGVVLIECAENLDQLFVEDGQIYLGYGEVVLVAAKVSADQVLCKVLQGGSVMPDMEVHIPATKKMTTLATIEQIDLKPFLDKGCGYLIIPGGWPSEEISSYKEKLKAKYGRAPWLILRLDSVAAQKNLLGSLEWVKGIVISRKELALTTSAAMVPILTKELIQLCNHKAKMVLTASDMLGSMRYKSAPTRAEVSDIANAVFDGTDAVVISEELNYGDFCGKAISLMHDIIRDAERTINIDSNWQIEKPKIVTEYDAIGFSAYQTARRIGAKAIVCITHQGNTAFSLSSFRPPIPIIAVTFDKTVTQNLNLIRGVSSVLMHQDTNIDQVFASVNGILKAEYKLTPGDKIIFVSITLSSIAKEASNLFTIQKVS